MLAVKIPGSRPSPRSRSARRPRTATAASPAIGAKCHPKSFGIKLEPSASSFPAMPNSSNFSLLGVDLVFPSSPATYLSPLSSSVRAAYLFQASILDRHLPANIGKFVLAVHDGLQLSWNPTI